jgi:hypothetical protein
MKASSPGGPDAKSKSGIKSRNWDHILTYCLRLCCLNCANTSSSEALHYITRNLLPKINTVIQSTNYVIHFIFFYDKNIIINSFMKTAILPFLGYSSSSVAFRQPPSTLKNRVNSSIYVKRLLLRYQFFRQVSKIQVLFTFIHLQVLLHSFYFYFTDPKQQTPCGHGRKERAVHRLSN